MKALLLCLILGGCASYDSPSPKVTVTCPVIRSYTLAEERAVAQALEGVPKDSPLRGFISDYGGLRKQVKACQSFIK